MIRNVQKCRRMVESNQNTENTKYPQMTNMTKNDKKRSKIF